MEKAGFKTTEFWVTILTLVYGIFGDQLGIDQSESGEIIAKLAAGFATVAYVISRTFAKVKKQPPP